MNYKAAYTLFKYEMLSSLRSKESIFFSLFFPALLFVIFGLAFKVNSQYAKFFLPGMIGTVFVSDAMYAVGPVIKSYYTGQIIRYFRGYPINIIWLFMGFIITRLIFVLFSTVILVLISRFLFVFTPDFPSFLRYTVGIIIGFTIYALIALSVSFYGIGDNKDQGVLSMLFFLSIFLSDSFFVLSKVNLAFDIIGYFFPLRVVLQFMRGDNMALIYCVLWLVVCLIIFYAIIRKAKLKRL